jgi:hypothetical protein
MFIKSTPLKRGSDKFLALACVFSLSIVAAVASESNPPPRVFNDDPVVLMASKTALAAGDASLQPALKQLLAEADRRLKQHAPSVMDKAQLPPSGDKHDYMSQAPYYWKDTNSPSGKYVRRDGDRNPEIRKNSDAANLGSVCTGVHTLGLAYYFTGDEKYAAKATELVRVWFLNPDTRMNPNLNYGQGIPGETEGRPTGLIGARGLANLVDGIGLLAGSQSWTAADQQGMVAWVGDYFHWLTTSKIGRGEDAADNNHGTFYDVQAISLALFLGDTDYAKKKLTEAQTRRIAKEIQPDGRMPRELGRTLSFNYSVFNLTAETELATLGSDVGIDLWHYQSADGRCLLKALEFMAPYANPDVKWPYPQIHDANHGDLMDILSRVTAQYQDAKLSDALKYYDPDEFRGNTQRLYLKLVAPSNQ